MSVAVMLAYIKASQYNKAKSIKGFTDYDMPTASLTFYFKNATGKKYFYFFIESRN